MTSRSIVVLCPGQGAQSPGMGRAWFEASAAARDVFQAADRTLQSSLGSPLSDLCFNGPAERLNRTDASQPAIYTVSVASARALAERDGDLPIAAAAGLSLGEYTALHLAEVFDFQTGLELVAERGRLMQSAAEASEGSMLALMGADEGQAVEICREAADGQVLGLANFNATNPPQIVLSGHAEACERAAQIAAEKGVRATPLSVAGAFHSALMQPAADRMAEVLARTTFQKPNIPVWSNVTAEPHDPENTELLKERLVEQIVRPVRWAQCCERLPGGDRIEFAELAPGAVLRGLMRRINRTIEVRNHDQP